MVEHGTSDMRILHGLRFLFFIPLRFTNRLALSLILELLHIFVPHAALYEGVVILVVLRHRHRHVVLLRASVRPALTRPAVRRDALPTFPRCARHTPVVRPAAPRRTAAPAPPGYRAPPQSSL